MGGGDRRAAAIGRGMNRMARGLNRRQQSSCPFRTFRIGGNPAAGDEPLGIVAHLLGRENHIHDLVLCPSSIRTSRR